MATALLLVAFAPVADAAAQGSGSTKTPIKHVIEIMFENHSFDNLFGTYPGPATASNGQVTQPFNLYNMSKEPAIKRLPAGTFTTSDPVEGYTAYHLDWNNGAMNGFYNNSGPQSMTTFTATQMAPEWDLAQQFSLNDMTFSMLTETTPNRVYNVAGYSPVMNDYGPPPFLPFSQTIFSELQKNGVSWAYYVMNRDMGCAPMNIIQGFSQYSNSIGNWTSFVSALHDGTLPNVSYVMPIGGGAPPTYSQGPTNNILFGEMWLLYLVNQVMHSEYWNSTAIFVTYDEGGGYYDQVNPPVVDGIQLGLRVPFILISPYAKEDYVSSTVLDQGSVLGFIDYNWNLPALNGFIADSNIPLDMFSFTTSSGGTAQPRSPINLAPLAALIPGSVQFQFNQSEYTNLSTLFPMDFQQPVNDLPYPLYGSSSFNLSQVSSILYVTHNFSVTPFYESTYFIWILVVATISAFVAFPLIRKKGGR